MTKKKLSRRDAIKLIGTAASATALANLPSKWSKPELTGGALPAHAQTSCTGTQTFDVPTSEGYDFVVPDCVTSLTVDAYGAQGGGSISGATGGLGGRTTFALPVTPGETLTIRVAGMGAIGNMNQSNPGGTNGGGNGSHGGGGGGGWSGVLRGTTMLVVAGGGGGGATSAWGGGDGGGTVGGNGAGPSPDAGGKGGTQINGGTGGNFGSGSDGGSGYGGSGAPGMFGTSLTGGGGGGGGYFGGGGGGGSSSGGGGSSFPPAATHAQGVNAGDGQVILTW